MNLSVFLAHITLNLVLTNEHIRIPGIQKPTIMKNISGSWWQSLAEGRLRMNIHSFATQNTISFTTYRDRRIPHVVQDRVVDENFAFR